MTFPPNSNFQLNQRTWFRTLLSKDVLYFLFGEVIEVLNRFRTLRIVEQHELYQVFKSYSLVKYCTLFFEITHRDNPNTWFRGIHVLFHCDINQKYLLLSVINIMFYLDDILLTCVGIRIDPNGSELISFLSQARLFVNNFRINYQGQQY